MMMAQLDEKATLVLRTVAERDMDGYTLARNTGLPRDEIEKAVRELTARELLRVKGEKSGPRLLESWFQAVPGAMQFLSGYR